MVTVVCAELVGGAGPVQGSATTRQVTLTRRCVSRRLNRRLHFNRIRGLAWTSTSERSPFLVSCYIEEGEVPDELVAGRKMGRVVREEDMTMGQARCFDVLHDVRQSS